MSNRFFFLDEVLLIRSISVKNIMYLVRIESVLSFGIIYLNYNFTVDLIRLFKFVMLHKETLFVQTDPCNNLMKTIFVLEVIYVALSNKSDKNEESDSHGLFIVLVK
jgi:hypothetical protein